MSATQLTERQRQPESFHQPLASARTEPHPRPSSAPIRGGMRICTWPGIDPKPPGHRGNSAEGIQPHGWRCWKLRYRLLSGALPCTLPLFGGSSTTQSLPRHFVSQDWVAGAAKPWEPTEGASALTWGKGMWVPTCSPGRISCLHITDASPARTLTPGQGDHGSVAPSGEAEFGLGEGEVCFGSAGTRASSEEALCLWVGELGP